MSSLSLSLSEELELLVVATTAVVLNHHLLNSSSISLLQSHCSLALVVIACDYYNAVVSQQMIGFFTIINKELIFSSYSSPCSSSPLPSTSSPSTITATPAGFCSRLLYRKLCQGSAKLTEQHNKNFKAKSIILFFI